MQIIAGILFLCFILTVAAVPGVPKTCLKGPYHKSKPGPEGEDYVDCHSWKSMSCCTASLTQELAKHRVKNMYDFHYDRCGPISPQCEEFLKDEECFYQCEPYAIRFQGPNPDTFTRIPICASYCDAWFKACENAKTCEEDWLNGFDYTKGENHCPAGKPCKTFKEVYTNGTGLCNKMWAHAFKYEPTNKNCMVMKFDPNKPNPNRLVFKTGAPGIGKK